MLFLDVQVTDFVTIGLLVLLEGLLSADNALVLAILVLGLPRDQQRKALRYGMLGAFVFRGLATALAAYLIDVSWVKLVGAAYLLYLPYTHFFQGNDHGGDRSQHKPARPWLGLSAFWGTVVKVELTDIVFALDSILVAVAMSSKLWVIITGGILGIIAMRMLIGKLLTVVQRYPPLVDGAFVIIAWVGIKLLIEYLHQLHYIGFVIPKWLSLGLIVVIFGSAYVYARWADAKAGGGAPAHDDTGGLFDEIEEAPAEEPSPAPDPEASAETARGAGASGEGR
jgi:YkoY family integral membrane protein